MLGLFTVVTSVEQRLLVLPNTAGKKELYGSNTCYFFPGPQSFCKKAVEWVRSEKNILNSGVEWVEWFFLEKAICMYIIRSARNMPSN